MQKKASCSRKYLNKIEEEPDGFPNPPINKLCIQNALCWCL